MDEYGKYFPNSPRLSPRPFRSDVSSSLDNKWFLRYLPNAFQLSGGTAEAAVSKPFIRNTEPGGRHALACSAKSRNPLRPSRQESGRRHLSLRSRGAAHPPQRCAQEDHVIAAKRDCPSRTSVRNKAPHVATERRCAPEGLENVLSHLVARLFMLDVCSIPSIRKGR